MSLPFFSVPSVLFLVTLSAFEKTKTEARHPRNEKNVLYEFTNNNEMTRVGAQRINKHKIPHDLTLFPDPSFLSLALLSVPFIFSFHAFKTPLGERFLCQRHETTKKEEGEGAKRRGNEELS
jgi:hypothetical protein